jgi:hypothetical protein
MTKITDAVQRLAAAILSPIEAALMRRADFMATCPHCRDVCFLKVTAGGYEILAECEHVLNVRKSGADISVEWGRRLGRR